MRRCAFWAAFLLVFLNLGRSAEAEPIQYVATFFLGLDGVNTMNPVGIPDPVLGGSVVLGGANLSQASSTASAQSLTIGQPIDNAFSFELGIKAPAGSSGPLINPFLDVTGHITGTILGPDPMIGRYSGGFSGTATAITVPFQPPGTILSPALEGLLQDPSRIHLSGIVTGGPANVLQTTLIIDPLVPGDPTPVPEPGTLATFAGAIGTLLLFQRYRSRRACRTPKAVCDGRFGI